MRIKFVMAVLTAFFAFGIVSPQPAMAIGGWFDHDRDRVPRAEREHRVVEHWLRHPRSRYPYRLHTAEDPYAYRYARRGYYPYYGAGYWRPLRTQQGRYRDGIDKPPYHPAWGYGARRCLAALGRDRHFLGYSRGRCHYRRAHR